MTEEQNDVPAHYPPPGFAAAANATADLYDAAEADRLAFWATQAERLHWDTRSPRCLDWSGAPVAKWFVGGRLNVAYNCVDRHVEAGNGDRVAIHWEGEPVGDERTITYAQLGRGVQGGQHAGGARSGRGRPGGHLHADGSRGDRRDARLCSAGHHALQWFSADSRRRR